MTTTNTAIPTVGPAVLVLGAASSSGSGGNFAVLAGGSITGTYNVSGNLGEDQTGGPYPPVYGSPTFTSSPPSNNEYGVSSGGLGIGANDPNGYGAAAYAAIFGAGGAYPTAIGEISSATTIPTELGGYSYAPGIYYNASELTLGSSPVTLENATGNSNNVYIFISGASLVTAASSTMVLHNVLPANIFWVVESANTLGPASNSLTTNFVGTIMSYAGINLNDTSLEGHAYCDSAAVVFSGTNAAITYP
jgi:hypothetical protein